LSGSIQHRQHREQFLDVPRKERRIRGAGRRRRQRREGGRSKE